MFKILNYCFCLKKFAFLILGIGIGFYSANLFLRDQCSKNQREILPNSAQPAKNVPVRRRFFRTVPFGPSKLQYKIIFYTASFISFEILGM